MADYTLIGFRSLMISGRQIRAARALLGWSQQELADRAIISGNALARLERGQVDSRFSTVERIERTLRNAGIEFLHSVGERGEGVRLSNMTDASERQRGWEDRRPR